MSKEQASSESVAAIGQDLVAHSKSSDLVRTRGLVVELFPYIFWAHEQMSARAISQYLKDKKGIKLSAVTITKALNDPRKSWNQFFDTIEQYVKTYEDWDKSQPREDFLYDDKGFKKLEFPGSDILRKALINFEVSRAVNALREKWFSIDLGVRIKARPYLAERLIGKGER